MHEYRGKYKLMNYDWWRVSLFISNCMINMLLGGKCWGAPVGGAVPLPIEFPLVFTVGKTAGGVWAVT